MRPFRRGFTLIELLVVIGIIAMLAAILVPSASKALNRARQAACLSNTHQIAVAVSVLLSEMEPDLPELGSNCLDFGAACEVLLPYVKGELKVFDCPSNPTLIKQTGGDGGTEIPGHSGTYTEYEINGYIASCNNEDRRQNGITDPDQAACAYDYPYDPAVPRRAHERGVNCAFLDGHALWLPDEEMGDLGNPTSPGNPAFYLRGHDFEEIYGLLR